MKNEINYCVPPTSHLFGNFPGVIRVEPTLCKHNDAKRIPIHRKFGASKWPEPTWCSKSPHTFCIGRFGTM